MISLKLAFLSVIRRPKQNIAVILGITLGVSLFLGVQIGSDSLAGGLSEFTEHSLGETDAQIYPLITPFFVTPDTITEIGSGGVITPEETISDKLMSNGDHLQYIKAITERLILSVTATQPNTGSIEVGKSLKGIKSTEAGFGKLYNNDNEELLISELAPNEIYLGEDTAKLLFLNENPVGKSLRLTAELISLNLQLLDPESNITSTSVKMDIEVTIKDVFLDRGKGEENYADYIVIDLEVLQNHVATAFTDADSPETPVLGYGSKPISNVLVAWEDDLTIGSESSKATKALEKKFREVMTLEISPGQFSDILANFYVVEDTRGVTEETIKTLTESLELLLNVFGSLIIAAGILVIINIQNMALSAREKETGIQRAIGASRGQIIKANLLESMFLGFIGSIIGVAGGYLYGQLLVLFMGLAFEFETSNIQIILTSRTIVTSVIAGFVISQITGIIPAIQASRVKISQVLRGIKPPSAESFSRRTFYLGMFLTFIALLQVFSLDPNPLFEGKDAFNHLDDVQKIYLPILLVIAGPGLLFAYYRSRKFGISIVGAFALIWAYFNIFFVFNWIEEGSGGLNYILYIILSLVVGSIILVAVNLSTIAAIGQNFFSFIAGKSKTTIRGTTMVAFRKMRSNVTRSTLTFALFATILTMNIFIGSWSYSFRYGYDQLVVDLSGGAEVMIATSVGIPESIDFDQELLDEFGDASRDVQITNLRSFTVTAGTPGVLNINDPSTYDSLNYVAIGQNSLWSDSAQTDWLFKFDLFDDKRTSKKENTRFETYKDESNDPAFSDEDGEVWKALVNNETMPNRNGIDKPIIISTFLADFSPTNVNQTHYPGDSVWLNLTDGSVQEFVIAAISNGSPLSDYGTPTEGPPTFVPWMYIGDIWKSKLLAFQGSSNTNNRFLGTTSEREINSNKIPKLMTEVEQWANKVDSAFNQQYGSFGVVGINVYSIYQAFLDGQFRFFSFLQAYVSLGFAVGILGLLVVASRSVAERKREIGMLRALGFKRKDVVISVVLELIVMGLIGLVLGLINGLVMGYGLTHINSGGDAKFIIPWVLILLYGFVTLASSIIAAIFPAINASRIPASDALRYTG